MTQDPAAPMMHDAPKKKRGGVLLLLGTVFLLVGILGTAVTGYFFYRGVSGMFGDYRSYDTPGLLNYEATADGTVHLFYPDTLPGDAYDVSVLASEGGDPKAIDVTRSSGGLNVNIGNSGGTARHSFEAVKSGEYIIMLTTDAEDAPTGNILVGPTPDFASIGSAFGFCLGIPAIVAGVVLLIIGLVLRLRS